MGLPAFANRNVLVMGLGRFGGGIGVTRWLCRAGANVTVTDLADGQALADSVQQLAGCNVFFHLGEHRTSDLDRVDLVVVSPAVDRRRSPFFAQVEARRIPWTTEINLFLSRCRGRVLGVTGTAGKSTTCALLHHALDGSLPKGRQAWFGGNVGRSLLNDLDDIGPDDVVVLELSSFQLETLPQIGTSPPIAAITNCWPNHLDRHADQAEYLAAKLNLFCHQQPGDHAVVPADDPGLVAAVEQVAARTGAQLVKFRLPTRPFDLRIPGRHNQHNAACAGTVARLLDLADAVIRNRMADFAGLPHRLEYVATTERGVACYNDSKATTPRGTASWNSAAARAGSVRNHSRATSSGEARPIRSQAMPSGDPSSASIGSEGLAGGA